MDKVLALMEDIGRYLTLLKVTDFVDIAIIIFLVYKLLSLVKSTRAENILKGVAIFLLALGLLWPMLRALGVESAFLTATWWTGAFWR